MIEDYLRNLGESEKYLALETLSINLTFDSLIYCFVRSSNSKLIFKYIIYGDFSSNFPAVCLTVAYVWRIDIFAL